MPRIDIDNDLCIGCELCVHICPEMVLGMAGGYVATVINLNRCNLCMACEKECSENAIKVGGHRNHIQRGLGSQRASAVH